MKSYIQGLITGGVFVFAFMVLTGSQLPKEKAQEVIDYISINKQLKEMGLSSAEVGTYQMVGVDKTIYLTDTRTGNVWVWDKYGLDSISPLYWSPLIIPK